MVRIKNILSFFGPGFIIAATGVGAGDMVAATVAGANFGTVILWAVILGALFKYVLNEGIARWQLSTNSSILQAWIHRIHPFVSYYFIIYLFVWSFIVAGALMSACGLAAHALVPQVSIISWGIIHSILAVALVYWGKYSLLEHVMKVFISLMFVTITINLFLIELDWIQVTKTMFSPQIPQGSIKFIFGMIGGVGGSVTLLSYGYWLSEKGWNEKALLPKSRVDLGMAYLFTGLFGIAVVILAAEVSPEKLSGNQIVINLAEKIMETTGTTGKWIFMLGFWGAVFSSMLGVWSGIPHLFQDFIQNIGKEPKTEHTATNVKSKYYNAFLFFMAFAPMSLLYLEKPVWIIILYSIAGAFFMPFLAGTLLFLNNQMKWIGGSKNGIITNLILVCTLILFVYLLTIRLVQSF